MNKIKILICDDSRAIHEALSAYLDSENMGYVSVFDGLSALQEARTNSFDLIILDIMMPGMIGTEVCKEIRKFSNVPIILLSAKGEEIDRILGLEIGADDYVVKPFSPREVVTRIKTILRRTSTDTPQQKRISISDLIIDIEKYEVFVGGIKKDLTAKEIEILFYLANHKGIVFSREQILNHVWGYDYFGDTRAVDTQIKRIRKKIISDDIHFDIKSIYGVGYKFEECI